MDEDRFLQVADYAYILIITMSTQSYGNLLFYVSANWWHFAFCVFLDLCVKFWKKRGKVLKMFCKQLKENTVKYVHFHLKVLDQ